MNKTSNKYMVLSICLALVLSTIAVYWPVTAYDFVDYDDNEYVSENGHIHEGVTAESIKWAFTTSDCSNWHPVTWLSHILDCEFFGLDPGRHHLTNLLLHTVNALLLFVVLKQMTGAIWQSGFVAAAFALHPLHVESVAWIAERKDVLSTLFWMLTMAAYLRYARKPHISWYLLALAFFALGLMAKPMLVTLPFVLLLLDYWPLRRVARMPGPSAAFVRPRGLVALVGEKVPFFILSAVSSVVTFLVQRSEGAMDYIYEPVLVSRIANAFICCTKYIGKMIWPGGLAVLYPHPGDAVSMFQAAVAALLLVAVSVCVIRLAPRRRYLPVGWLWYVGTLVPVIGLVQVGGQAMADRYTYVPLIGLFIIVAWGVGEFSAKWKYRKVVLGVSAFVILCALSITSRFTVGYWRNGVKLFGRAVAVTDNNVMMHYNLANALVAQGVVDEGIAQYRKALEIWPEYAKAHNNLGYALFSQGKYDEALGHYRKALEVEPELAEAYNNLGIAFQRQGRVDEAVAHFRRALELRPDFAEARSNIILAFESAGRFEEAGEQRKHYVSSGSDEAQLYFNLGNAAKSQGRLDQALEHFRRALRIRPDFAEAHNNLGIVLQGQGRVSEAVEHYRQAVKIRPDYTEAYGSLGIALKSQGKFNEAVDSYRRVLQINPDNAEVHNNLANLLAAQGKLGEAVSHYRRALVTKPGDVKAHSNLALTLSRMGRLDEALEHFRQALRLEPDMVPSLNGAALILVLHPDPAVRDVNEAIGFAERAAELTRFKSLLVLDTLAGAYAAAGRLDRALETLQKALELASASGNAELAGLIRRQIEAYKQPSR